MNKLESIILENLSETFSSYNKKYTINEVAIDPYQFEWKEKSISRWIGKFKSDSGIIIECEITRDLDFKNIWELSFGAYIPNNDISHDRYDTGNPFKVFKTIQIMLNEFNQQKISEVAVIRFDSEKENYKDSRDSRAILYNRFAKNWDKYFKGNWDKIVLTEYGDHIKTFFIINKDYKSSKDILDDWIDDFYYTSDYSIKYL